MDYTCSKCKKVFELPETSDALHAQACSECGGILLPSGKASEPQDAFFEYTNPAFKRKNTGGFKPKRAETRSMSILPSSDDPSADFAICEPTQPGGEEDKTVKIAQAALARAVRPHRRKEAIDDDLDPTVKKSLRKANQQEPTTSWKWWFGSAFLFLLCSAVGVLGYRWVQERWDSPSPITRVEVSPLEGKQAENSEKEPQRRQFERRLFDAEQLIRQGNWVEALASLEEANQLDNDRPEVLLLTGKVFLEGFSALEMAELEYKRLLYRRDTAEAHRELATVYERKGDLYKAVEEYKHYLGRLEVNSTEWKQVLKKIEMLSRQL